jgi:C4-dicarboxylate-specific signal transduction histidine kinase
MAIWTTVTLPSEDGRPEGILSIGTDVTERIAAERELQLKHQELSHLTRVATVGELAASLAHELNQPLTAMSNNAAAGLQMLKREAVDVHEFRELLADISADGLRAGSVIHGLRDMVRKQGNVSDDVELNRIVVGTITLTRPAASAFGCTVVTELDPSNPVVKANAIQIEQVLMNLMVNAFDAMKTAATRDPRVQIETRQQDDDIVVVEVRDNGPGLPSKAPSSVFERFYSTKPHGMGMGLSIARSIIEAHHGRLHGENLRDGGARLWFSLPLIRKPAP